MSEFGANGSELAETPTGGLPTGRRLTGLTRVHFSAEDLARTRFAARPAPLVETVLSLDPPSE